MKKISLLALMLSMTTAVALSDGAVATGAPCPPAPCPCPKAFQGFYIGGSFGYAIGSVKGTTSAPVPPAAAAVGHVGHYQKSKIGVQGFDGGAIVGYNYVFSSKFGLGLEAYFNWASTSGKTETRTGFMFPPSDRYVTQKVSMKNSFQLRVPFSYVICNLVAPKVIVGWDNARWSYSANWLNGDSAGTKSARYNGFLWGAGVDFLVAKHAIFGFEFAQTFYGAKSLALKGATPADVPKTKSKCKIAPNNTFKATLKFIY